MDLNAARRADRLFLARLEKQAEVLQGQVFPGRLPGPYRWLALIRGVIDTANGYLDRSEKDSSLDKDSQIDLINKSARLAQLSFDCLTCLQGAEASELPHAVVRPLKRWLDDLGIKQTSFFRAEHLANYELASYSKQYFQQISSPASSLTEAIKYINWPFFRITVPSRALGMFPYFALVAHEAGHAIYRDLSLDINLERPNELKQLQVSIETRVGAQLTQKQSIDVRKILSSWIEELAADAVAHHIAGPAFYFSSTGFIQITNPGFGMGMSHPPSDLRRKLLFSQMKKRNDRSISYVEVFNNRTSKNFDEDINSPALLKCPSSDKLFNDLISMSGYESHIAATMVESIVFLEEIYDTIYDKSLDYLKNNCSNLIYTPEIFDRDLNNHLDKLCLLIPPIEEPDSSGKSVATSLSTVLNVGWVALLTQLDKIKVQPDKFGNEDSWRMERLHTLLVKAAELSEARRSWEEVT